MLELTRLLLGCAGPEINSPGLCGLQNGPQKSWKAQFSTKSGFLRLMQVILRLTEAGRVGRWPGTTHKMPPYLVSNLSSEMASIWI